MEGTREVVLFERNPQLIILLERYNKRTLLIRCGNKNNKSQCRIIYELPAKCAPVDDLLATADARVDTRVRGWTGGIYPPPPLIMMYSGASLFQIPYHLNSEKMVRMGTIDILDWKLLNWLGLGRSALPDIRESLILQHASTVDPEVLNMSTGQLEGELYVRNYEDATLLDDQPQHLLVIECLYQGTPVNERLQPMIEALGATERLYQSYIVHPESTTVSKRVLVERIKKTNGLN